MGTLEQSKAIKIIIKLGGHFLSGIQKEDNLRVVSHNKNNNKWLILKNPSYCHNHQKNENKNKKCDNNNKNRSLNNNNKSRHKDWAFGPSQKKKKKKTKSGKG